MKRNNPPDAAKSDETNVSCPCELGKVVRAHTPNCTWMNENFKQNNSKMKNELYEMLMADAEADKKKALLTLDLLSNYPAGIGDHSTEDFYNNAKDALRNLVDANDRIETLKDLKL